MPEQTTVGLIGVGLMGHGIAKNVLTKGFGLVFLEHPGNRPVEDLRELGASSAGQVADVVRASDVVLLCVTGSPQVESVVFGNEGLLEGLSAGQFVVDCSTAQPDSTLRVAEAIERAGGRFVDAPMTRTPKEAEEGRLNVMVGGAAEVLEEVRPVLAAFAENIYHAGPVGSGHRLKLLHNFISLGNSVLLAEAVNCAREGKVDMGTFVEVLASGGGGSVVLQRLAPYILEGDDSGFRFSLSNGRKDMHYYTAMADQLGVLSFAAHAVQQIYGLAVEAGAPERPVPALIDILSSLKAQR